MAVWDDAPFLRMQFVETGCPLLPGDVLYSLKDKDGWNVNDFECPATVLETRRSDGRTQVGLLLLTTSCAVVRSYTLPGDVYCVLRARHDGTLSYDHSSFGTPCGNQAAATWRWSVI